MHDLYPELTPFQHGFLPVMDGHSVFFEVSGNPLGSPALILHGGPGSGSSASARRYFDPKKYKIIQFDQRNCGRSLPHASEPEIDLTFNSLEHLLADIERLREYLAIERWLVLGGSWGATLALAYVQKHPNRIAALVLNSVATTTRKEIDWITRGVGAFFPREWQEFRNFAGPIKNDDDLVSAYYEKLLNSRSTVHQPAADAWCRWEMAIVDVTPGHQPHPRWQDPRFRLSFSRLVTHVWHHNAWLKEDQLWSEMQTIAHIPGRLIHGRLDFGSPLITAWKLKQHWPQSSLTIVETSGHDTRDTGMRSAIMNAIDGVGRTEQV